MIQITFQQFDQMSEMKSISFVILSKYMEVY